MLRALRGFDTDIKPVFRAASDQIGGRLQRSAFGARGTIPVRELAGVQRDAGAIIERVFVSVDGRRSFTDDNVALSPFATALNKWAVNVTAAIVKNHAAFMRARLPVDVERWLVTGRRTVSEQFSSQAFVDYSPTWTWMDERGYVLSDRIWRTSIDTRTRLDAFLADHIRRGTGSLRMSRLLERFLLPDRPCSQVRMILSSRPPRDKEYSC